MAPRTWTIRDVLTWTTAHFSGQGLDSPRLDAEVLLAHCLGQERIQLYVDFDKPMAAEELAAYRALVRRRLQHEPVAYIIGQREFWSAGLWVDTSVLVPRPETELLVELTLGLPPLGGRDTTVADIGTGSGAVAIALALERPAWEVHATELSAQALAVTERNAARHEVRLTLHQGDLLAPLDPALPLDLVVSNPPYIPTAELEGLPPDVRRWEPALALDGGPQGMDVYGRLIPQAAARLQEHGHLLLEVGGAAQAEAVARLMTDHGLRAATIHPDLAGVPRVVCGQGPR